MFTSLSTVGFGDYNPRSDNERLVCLAILLFGVSIFSYVMGNFIAIVDQYSMVQKELEEYDKLIVFFSMFRKFNGGKPINQSLVDKIEKFFDYRWKNDRR
jgi:hypothetical protein